MVQFIDQHREAYGVEPICAVLPIAPSTYHRHVAQRADPTRRSARAQRDDRLRPEIQRVFEANQQVYGVRKVWKQLRRERIAVPRCAVARLMQQLALEGVRRGRRTRTTVPADVTEAPRDLVARDFVPHGIEDFQIARSGWKRRRWLLTRSHARLGRLRKAGQDRIFLPSSASALRGRFPKRFVHSDRT